MRLPRGGPQFLDRLARWEAFVDLSGTVVKGNVQVDETVGPIDLLDAFVGGNVQLKQSPCAILVSLEGRRSTS